MKFKYLGMFAIALLAIVLTGCEEKPKPPKPNSSANSMFDRDWHLSIPGAVWTDDNIATDTSTLHVSAGSGSLPHVLNISTDGTYMWKAYDEVIRGRWEHSDNVNYPIILQKAYEGKNWNVSLEKYGLLLWDGESLAGQFHGS